MTEQRTFAKCDPAIVRINEKYGDYTNQPVNMALCVTFWKSFRLGPAPRKYPSIKFQLVNGELLEWVFLDNKTGEGYRDKNYLALIWNYAK